MYHDYHLLEWWETLAGIVRLLIPIIQLMVCQIALATAMEDGQKF
jgi:hypothetical protein